MITTLYPSPVGPLTLTGRPGALSGLRFGAAPGAVDDGGLSDVRAQLDAYFAGARRSFDLDLDLAGTEWERTVWGVLRTIPYGETWTYGQVAEIACTRTGARAARAVGRANHNNPVAIVVPCHRVIGADGRLVGFGGGLEVKRSLLDLEAGRIALV